MSVAAVATSRFSARAPIRVMVVDDSVVVRGLVSRWLAEEGDFAVVASVRTGVEAVEQVERADPDVVLLDIEMPELDGISALPQLLAKKRDLVVIMASTLTRRNAEISLRALSLGAADYIPKPQTRRDVATSAEFRRELVEKIRQLARRRTFRRTHRDFGMPASQDARVVEAARKVTGAGPAAGFVLLPWSHAVPRVLAIGSSTGGPQALTGVMGSLGPIIDRVPVLVTQHMPPTFTTILAEHLARACGRPVAEAKDGEPAVAGRIYVAPGGRHMSVATRGVTPVIRLDDSAPVNFCRPSVDPLFRSVAAVWGRNVLALVLTGMGADGVRGAEDIVAAGGNVIAQDEETSIVWGMPGAAAHAGVCAAVLPLAAIAPRVKRILLGDFS